MLVAGEDEHHTVGGTLVYARDTFPYLRVAYRPRDAILIDFNITGLTWLYSDLISTVITSLNVL